MTGSPRRRCLRIREALATDPKEKLARVNLMTVVARCGDHARAAAIGRELLATPPQDEQILDPAFLAFIAEFPSPAAKRP